MSNSALKSIDGQIAKLEAQLGRWREARARVIDAVALEMRGGTAGPVVSAPPAPRAAARPGKVVAGSLEDRVLELARAPLPVKLRVIVRGASARRPDVAAAVKRLVAQGLIVRTGIRAGTRYRTK